MGKWKCTDAFRGYTNMLQGNCGCAPLWCLCVMSADKHIAWQGMARPVSPFVGQAASPCPALAWGLHVAMEATA